MYYLGKYDATLVINVNRLDRDNRGRSTPVLVVASQAIRSSLKPKP
jgi:hypothetical protein